MKIATIDIGSNSILLLVGELEQGKLVQTLRNESRVTGLGRNLDETGEFLKVAQEESFEALEQYKNICLEEGIDPRNIIATATEASRVARNAAAFFEKVKKELGIDVITINALGEAYYSTKGILLGESPKEAMTIMDIGGASTEFISLDAEKNIVSSFSLPVGSVRVTNWMEAGDWKESFKKAIESFEEQLNDLDVSTLHCVAGTLTSLANMHLQHKEFIESEVHGHVLESSDIETMVQVYSDFSPEQFLEKFPFLGKRSRAIRGGLFLTRELGTLLKVDKFKVSTYGLRYGTLLEGKVRGEHVF
ncbi:MAG: hypothetical protein KC478_01955 [Bacteriovoracaceae bacterium]|nr:hypothetical protein [Bacteriovoracaceae bacterium]